MKLNWVAIGILFTMSLASASGDQRVRVAEEEEETQEQSFIEQVKKIASDNPVLAVFAAGAAIFTVSYAVYKAREVIKQKWSMPSIEATDLAYHEFYQDILEESQKTSFNNLLTTADSFFDLIDKADFMASLTPEQKICLFSFMHFGLQGGSLIAGDAHRANQEKFDAFSEVVRNEMNLTLQANDNNRLSYLMRKAPKAVCYSVNGSKIAGVFPLSLQRSGSLIRVWNREDGSCIALLLDPDPISLIEFDYDGERLAAISTSGAIKIYDLDTERIVTQLNFRLEAQRSINWENWRRMLENPHLVRLINNLPPALPEEPASMRVLQGDHVFSHLNSQRPPVADEREVITCVAFSRSGNLLAVSTNRGHIRVYGLSDDSGIRCSAVLQIPIERLFFLHEGADIIAIGTGRVYQLRKRELRPNLDGTADWAYDPIELSNDLAPAGLPVQANEAYFAINLRTTMDLRSLLDAGLVQHRINFLNPSLFACCTGTRVVSLSENGTLDIWQLNPVQHIASIPTIDEGRRALRSIPEVLAFYGTNTEVICIYKNGLIKIWRLRRLLLQAIAMQNFNGQNVAVVPGQQIEAIARQYLNGQDGAMRLIANLMRQRGRGGFDPLQWLQIPVAPNRVVQEEPQDTHNLQ